MGRDSAHSSHTAVPGLPGRRCLDLTVSPSWLGAREGLQTQVARSSTVKEWRAAMGQVPQHRAEASVPLPQGLSHACSIPHSGRASCIWQEEPVLSAWPWTADILHMIFLS